MIRPSLLGGAVRVPLYVKQPSAKLLRAWEWMTAWMDDHAQAGIEVTPDECAEQWVWSLSTAAREVA